MTEKTIELDRDAGQMIYLLSQRIQGFEDAITEVAKSLQAVRKHHASEIVKALRERGCHHNAWAAQTNADGTVTIHYRTPEQPSPAPKERKKRGK